MTHVTGEPRVFAMIRHGDESGVSGTGRVLDGVVFPCGYCVICWRTAVNSVGWYETFEHFKKIHIDPHPTNRTEIVWTASMAPSPQHEAAQFDVYNAAFDATYYRLDGSSYRQKGHRFVEGDGG